jgi:hypothetical protein
LILSQIILTADFKEWESAFSADMQGRPGQLAMLVRERPVPLELRERLALRLQRTPFKQIGRPKAKRNEFGATKPQENLVASYEYFWNAFEDGASYDEAKDTARKLCATTGTELEKVIWNKNTPVNLLTRQRGTFRENPTKRFSELLKTSAAAKRG